MADDITFKATGKSDVGLVRDLQLNRDKEKSRVIHITWSKEGSNASLPSPMYLPDIKTGQCDKSQED